MVGQKWLLDTNVLLAALIKPEVLPTDTQKLLQDPTSTVYFSAASMWEIAIKQSLGRDDFDFLPEDIHQLALQTGFTELPIASSHSYAIARMPWHHRDPFDRLLIAQAQSIPAYLLTTDAALEQYSELVKRIAVKSV
ncbi:MAG: twitching motility protein PilT [Hydrogenophilales bacterium 12-61-10]|nr:MAG: twitching motility protein PilT [Hydrogenophilales bacterium 12-61-10]OYX28380.1 MAG: twitching motility protein PilT [Hydrogenophilales bacterium 32-62-9]